MRPESQDKIQMKNEKFKFVDSEGRVLDESNSKVIIRNAIERKPNYFYIINFVGDLLEYRNYRWKYFTFKEILECMRIDIQRLRDHLYKKYKIRKQDIWEAAR